MQQAEEGKVMTPAMHSKEEIKVEQVISKSSQPEH
jgi:hypothetical protein